MTFQGKTKRVQQQFETPEVMYLRGSLPRTADAVSGLWIHQGDVLRAFAEEHRDTSDLALELPTGTGKTFLGCSSRSGYAARPKGQCSTQHRRGN